MKPSLISGEILNIIDEAKDKLIIVSPYNKLNKWPKLQSTLHRALNRGVNIEFVVRAPEKFEHEEDLKALEDFGINPLLVPKLHCKFYMNDSTAVVTSMNLLKSSDDYALEIGYETETKDEYQDLLNFYNKFILPIQIKPEFDINRFVEVVHEDLNRVVSYPGRKSYFNDDHIRFNQHSGYTFNLQFGNLTAITWIKKTLLTYIDKNRHKLNSLQNWRFDFDAESAGNNGGYFKAIYKQAHSSGSLDQIEIEQAKNYHEDIVHLIYAMDELLKSAEKETHSSFL